MIARTRNDKNDDNDHSSTNYYHYQPSKRNMMKKIIFSTPIPDSIDNNDELIPPSFTATSKATQVNTDHDSS
jgi:hypothetical protein